MKILGIEKLYEEAFVNGIVSSTNIEESCEQYFSLTLFKNYMDYKIMQTEFNYDEEKDVSTLIVTTYVDIPIFNRYGKKAILYNYYKLVRYVRKFEKCELFDEVVEILD